MPTPIPSTTNEWLNEVVNHFEVAAMAAAGDGLDETPDHARWVSFIQRQAINSCRNMRGMTITIGGPELELDEMEAVDEIAHALRNDLPGDVRDVVSETQLFLLFYLAAHVRAALCEHRKAIDVVMDCWHACAGDCDDSPWTINADPPDTAEAWATEIVTAFAATAQAPVLSLSDGKTFQATSLLEAATALALNNRKSEPDHAAVVELIDSIRAMESDVSSMGPEWQDMCRVPAMAFSMYYVWVHLAIGLTNEETAMHIMQACTRRIGDFPDSTIPPP
jgi:hypothetical protein